MMGMKNTHLNQSLQICDPEISQYISLENNRQSHGLEMIASENYASLAVMQAQGSILTNKYAEGYPGKRYYGGCTFVDGVESLAIDRLKKNLWMSVCKCTTTFRFTGEYGCLPCFDEGRRHCDGNGPFPWWTSYPRIPS